MFVSSYNNAILADWTQTGSGLAGKHINPKSSSISSRCLGLFSFMPVLQHLLSRVPNQQQDGIKSKYLPKNYSECRSAFGRTMEEKNPSNVTPDNLALERFTRPLPLAAIRHKGSGRFVGGRSSALLVSRMLDVLGFLGCKDKQYLGVQGIAGLCKKRNETKNKN